MTTVSPRRIAKKGTLFLHSRPTRRALTVLCLVWVALMLAPLLAMSFYAYPTHDDFPCVLPAAKVWAETGSLWATLKAAWNQAMYDYQTWQGTYVAMFVCAFQPMVFSMRLFWLAPFGTLALLALSAWYLARQVTRFVLKGDLCVCAALYAALMTLLLEYVPGIRELIYWQSAIQYALSVVAVMLLCGLMIRLHAASARPAAYAWRTAAALLCAVALGGLPYPLALGGAALAESVIGGADGPTSILVIFPAAHADCHAQDAAATTRGSASIQAPILALGLPEEAFERENNLITASDVRAVILSRLRLPAWGTLWDVGAGSGSVGLEAAALRPALGIHGIERNPERCAMIERNRLGMGIANYTLHPGDALSVIRASCPESPAPSACGGILPDPDRVFIGGGGKDLPALLTACRNRLRSNGLIVVSAVTLESFRALLSWAPDHRAGLCRIDIANECLLAKHHLRVHIP